MSYPSYNSSCFQCPEQPSGTGVAYVTAIQTATSVVSGGTAIPVGTIIPNGDTTVPIGTVSTITGYTGVPSTNVGGIVQTNGFFSIPCAGNYNIIANICFSATGGALAADSRIVEIYKVDSLTGLVTSLAIDSRVPISDANTCINVAATDYFRAGDRVFIAARQTNGAAATVSTVAGSGRLSIIKME